MLLGAKDLRLCIMDKHIRRYGQNNQAVLLGQATKS